MSHEQVVISNEWYTPKYVFNALGVTFDLDPASPIDRYFCNVPAKTFISNNSLEIKWNGFVWLNPPYGNEKNKMLWIQKFIDHGNGLILMPDRTSAKWWQLLANKSCSLLFVKRKIKFINQFGEVGNSPSNGSTIFAIGQRGKEALENAQKNNLGIRFN